MLPWVDEPAWPALLDRLEAPRRDAGLDLVHPFAVGWYNSRVGAEHRLDDFGRPQSLGILLANTRALWPAFQRARERDAALRRAEHPLDAYVTARVASLARLLAPLDVRSYLVHVTEPRPLPVQRLAELVGFAGVGPSQLAVHPLHGPWVAFRAVLVVDTPGPQDPPELHHPCRGCREPCLPALQAALRLSGATPSSQTVAEHAAAWIAVRDACPVGRASRYGAEQLAYHYLPSSRHAAKHSKP